MNEVVILIIFLIIGVITGIASSLLGIGGGLIFVPSLTFLLPYLGIPNQNLIHIVIATSLFAGSFSSFSAFIQHYKMKNIDLKKSLLLASGSIITAFLVPKLVISINAELLKLILGIILLTVALKLLFEKNEVTLRQKQINEKFLFFFGLVIGTIPAISGLGAGVIFVPVLTYFFSLNIKKAIGTSTLVVALTMISSTIAYGILKPFLTESIYQLGYVNLLAGGTLGIGAIVGSNFGAKIIKIISTNKLKKIFAIFIILVVLKMLI